MESRNGHMFGGMDGATPELRGNTGSLQRSIDPGPSR